MYVRCWSCGNDLEVSESEIRQQEKERLASMLERISQSYSVTGNTRSADFYREAAARIRNN